MKTILSLVILTTFSVLNPYHFKAQIGDMVDNFELQTLMKWFRMIITTQGYSCFYMQYVPLRGGLRRSYCCFR